MESEERKASINQIMSLKEVAKYLGLHTVTIYRLLKETDVPAIKLRGQWRFKKDVLDAWLVKGMKNDRTHRSKMEHKYAEI